MIPEETIDTLKYAVELLRRDKDDLETQLAEATERLEAAEKVVNAFKLGTHIGYEAFVAYTTKRRSRNE